MTDFLIPHMRNLRRKRTDLILQLAAVDREIKAEEEAERRAKQEAMMARQAAEKAERDRVKAEANDNFLSRFFMAAKARLPLDTHRELVEAAREGGV